MSLAAPTPARETPAREWTPRETPAREGTPRDGREPRGPR
jgi:hypothetical protein